MKTKIFIDFDGTLFETILLKEKIFKICQEFGFSHEQIVESYRLETADGLFSPGGLVERLRRYKEFDYKSALEKINAEISKSAVYLFDDSLVFLKKLNRAAFEVNLMTLGDDNFQRSKVENSGIASLFDNVYFVSKNKWEIMDQYVSEDEKFVFIDDRADTINNISSKFSQSVCLCIKRKEEDHDDLNKQREFDSIVKIRELKEVFNYI